MAKRQKVTKGVKGTRLSKRILYLFVGLVTYPGLYIFNRLRINGMERLSKLPRQNVLFVCNHHTYFADVITLIHIFCAANNGRKKKLGWPFYLFRPFLNIRYVAAATTMSKTMVARFFTLAGAITVKRTWNPDSGENRKGLELADTRAISRELEENWVITFPQGTTTPYAPGRRGAAFIIKQNHPIVVPVVFKGFSDTFDKTGLKIRNWRSKLEVTFKEPMQINYEDSAEDILVQIMDAIEQSEKYKDSNVQLVQ